MNLLKIAFILLIGSSLFSCGTGEQKKEQNEPRTVASNNVTALKDTTIIYNVEGISSEGTEATVKYIAGKIKEGQIKIFGERGQADILYSFSENQISVTEKNFVYKESLENVNSDSDMKLNKERKYLIDFEGKPIGKFDEDRIDIFAEFKKAVPFTIK